MKKLIGVVIAIAVLGGIAAFFLLSNLNGMVKGAVESAGTQVTGTAVSLASVDIDIQSGKGTLKGLTIANPSGFPAGDAFSLAEITVAIDLGSIRDNPIVINQIVVDGATVNYIAKGKSSNLQKIQENVNSSGSDSGSSGDDGGGAETRIIIDEFRFTDASMTLAVEGAPAVEKTVNIKDIVQNDVGRAQGGATPAEAANEILKPILKQAVTEAIKALGGDGLMDKVKGFFKQ